MDLKEAVNAYAQATTEFLSVANELTESQLDASDSIAEPGTQIQGYDEAGWGENETLGYKDLPIAHSLDVFKAVRTSSLEIIKRLTPAQLDNSGTHSESGEYTIKTWLETYISHPLEHAAQIESGL